jgi:hypothetical protein
MAIIAIERKEYEEITAFISKQFNESVDLLHEDMVARLSALRIQRDEMLIAALNNFIKIITSYLSENDLSILMELGIIPSHVDIRSASS